MEEEINMERRNLLKKVFLTIIAILTIPFVSAKNMTWFDGITERFSTRYDYLQTDGAVKITVDSSEPTSPSTGDLWVDTS